MHAANNGKPNAKKPAHVGRILAKPETMFTFSVDSTGRGFSKFPHFLGQLALRHCLIFHRRWFLGRFHWRGKGGPHPGLSVFKARLES